MHVWRTSSSGNGKVLERTKCHSLVMPGWPSDSCKPFRLLERPATEQTRDKASAATFSFPDLYLTSYANIPSSARQAWIFEFLISTVIWRKLCQYLQNRQIDFLICFATAIKTLLVTMSQNYKACRCNLHVLLYSFKRRRHIRIQKHCTTVSWRPNVIWRFYKF